MTVPDEFHRGSERWFLRGGGFSKQNAPKVRISLAVEMSAAGRETLPAFTPLGNGTFGHFHWEYEAYRLTYDVRVLPSGGPLLPSVWPCEIRAGTVVLKSWMWAGFLMDGQVHLRGTAELYSRTTLMERRDFSFLIRGEETRTDVVPLGRINGDRGEVRIRTSVMEGARS